MLTIIFILFFVILLAYMLYCFGFYFSQEKFIFSSDKLDKDYKFNFKQDFEEINVKTNDGLLLNGLLFKSKDSKGLIFYLHGNLRSIKRWGEISSVYTNLGYDMFMFDYRGFGKSEGCIKSQQQLFDDASLVYNEMKKRYSENEIVIMGYSLGTGISAYLAAQNHPRLLILIAPYYSFADLIRLKSLFIPRLFIKYKLDTYKYINNLEVPVVIFHGDKDEVIDYKNSVSLSKLFKQQDFLITLKNARHDDIMGDSRYFIYISNLLA